MSKPDRSCVYASCRGSSAYRPAPQASALLWSCGVTLLMYPLPLPQCLSQQTPHAQDELYFIIRG